MRKHLNRIKRFEEETGISSTAQDWLAWIDTDGTVELSQVPAAKHTPKRKKLTASEFEAFKKDFKADNILTVEWGNL